MATTKSTAKTTKTTTAKKATAAKSTRSAPATRAKAAVKAENNGKKKNSRVSVLKKLRQKQAEIAKRSGKPAQQMEAAEDMERRRK